MSSRSVRSVRRALTLRSERAAGPRHPGQDLFDILPHGDDRG
ncbi:hypothetical protein KPATCC21470_4270 [Kitasatospora purpeofusca]